MTQKLTIIGGGLVGASLACALRPLDLDVTWVVRKVFKNVVRQVRAITDKVDGRCFVISEGLEGSSSVALVITIHSIETRPVVSWRSRAEDSQSGVISISFSMMT